MSKIKVLIADDQALMRDGLATILEVEEDIEVIATANDGQQAWKLATEYEVDLILMDIRMPKMNGIESTRKIKEENSNIAVLALTTFDDQEYIVKILNNGAQGYLLKDIDGDKLVQAIKDVVEGDFIMPSEVASKLAANVSNTQAGASKADTELKDQSDVAKQETQFDLSPREEEVAAMLAEGFTNKQIASALYLSHGTVKNYVSSIYSKIEIRDRTKAALYLKEELVLVE